MVSKVVGSIPTVSYFLRYVKYVASGIPSVIDRVVQVRKLNFEKG